MTSLQERMALRLEEKRVLYERFGRSPEEAHTGAHVVISEDGLTILGEQPGEVLLQGLETFGKGKFGLFRVGYRAFAQWLLAG